MGMDASKRMDVSNLEKITKTGSAFLGCYNCCQQVARIPTFSVFLVVFILRPWNPL